MNRTADKPSAPAMIYTAAVLCIGSSLPVILAREYLDVWPMAVQAGQTALLMCIGAAAWAARRTRYPFALPAVLTVLTGLTLLSDILRSVPFWNQLFHPLSMHAQLWGNVLLKIIPAAGILGMLLMLYGKPEAFYFTKGNLSVSVEPIRWLGIPADSISWKRLTLITAPLIGTGTALFVLLPFRDFLHIPSPAGLIPLLPSVIVLAVLNSLFEGIMFRCGLLGVLKEHLPKQTAVLGAAAVFGAAHFYGAPSGFLGIAVSTLLGWFLGRSVYETRGFLAAWIIHGVQDIIIFSLFLLLFL